MQTLLADQDIPQIETQYGEDFRCVTLPASELTRARILSEQATIVLVRSVTPVDAALLADTSVRWVGTATSGYDHLDRAFLSQQGIGWYAATGCNAPGVCGYMALIFDALDALQTGPKPTTAGIIGMGHVGRLVAQVAKTRGLHVWYYDPPRADVDPDFSESPQRVSDLTALSDVDILCIHAALTQAGPNPSFHLINRDFLSRLNPNATLINAARGAIIDSAAYLALPTGRRPRLCADVHESEPNVCPEWIHACTIATPHIAGYTWDSRLRASGQVAEALYRAMGRTPPQMVLNLNAALNPSMRGDGAPQAPYAPQVDTVLLQEAAHAGTLSDTFLRIRRAHPRLKAPRGVEEGY